MTKLDAYRYLSATPNSDLSWIANVFLTNGGPLCARTLKALATLVQAGHEVHSISFRMPYESLYVDGVEKTPGQVRAMADAMKTAKK